MTDGKNVAGNEGKGYFVPENFLTDFNYGYFLMLQQNGREDEARYYQNIFQKRAEELHAKTVKETPYTDPALMSENEAVAELKGELRGAQEELIEKLLEENAKLKKELDKIAIDGKVEVVVLEPEDVEDEDIEDVENIEEKEVEDETDKKDEKKDIEKTEEKKKEAEKTVKTVEKKKPKATKKATGKNIQFKKKK